MMTYQAMYQGLPPCELVTSLSRILGLGSPTSHIYISSPALFLAVQRDRAHMITYFSNSAQNLSRMHFAYLKHKTAATTIRRAVWYEVGKVDNMADERISIQSRDPKRVIEVDVYRPSSSGSKNDGYLVNLYGSFFTIDALAGTDVVFLRKMADESGVTVYDVHYRLAPEHPFPAAFEDGEDVIQSLPKNANIAISGFASGGNLALGLSSSSSVSQRIKSVFAMYPIVDLTLREKELKAPDPSVPNRMSPEAAAVLNDCYLYGGVNVKDPRVSPGLAPAESYPQDVFLFTAAQDSHCEQGEDLVRRIEQAGKAVRHKRYEGVGSLFDKQAKEGSAAARATEEVYGMFAKYLQAA